VVVRVVVYWYYCDNFYAGIMDTPQLGLNKFVCGDGTVIPKDFTCDGRIDCPDESDESFDECGEY